MEASIKHEGQESQSSVRWQRFVGEWGQSKINDKLLLKRNPCICAKLCKPPIKKAERIGPFIPMGSIPRRLAAGFIPKRVFEPRRERRGQALPIDILKQIEGAPRAD